MKSSNSKPEQWGAKTLNILVVFIITMFSGCNMRTDSSVHRTQEGYERISWENLTAIFAAISEYARTNHRPPESLTELMTLQRKQLVCPFTNDTVENNDVSYIYRPEAFGKAKIMVYSRSVTEQDYGFAVLGNGEVKQISKSDLSTDAR